MLRSFFNILILILCISIFGYAKADDSSKKTHGDVSIAKTTIQSINLPRIVRSSISKPENIDFSMLSQQNQIDNKGIEFWVCFQQNFDNIEHPLSLKFFITSDFNTNVTVQIPGISWQQQYSVIANEITTVYIPSPLNVVVNGEGRFNKGIHILSDEEVTVYGLNQMQYTTDAYLALPLDILNVFHIYLR